MCLNQAEPDFELKGASMSSDAQLLGRSPVKLSK